MLSSSALMASNCCCRSCRLCWAAAWSSFTSASWFFNSCCFTWLSRCSSFSASISLCVTAPTPPAIMLIMGSSRRRAITTASPATNTRRHSIFCFWGLFF